MPYILDENGDYALDKNGNKLQYTVEYINDDHNPFINNKTELLINDNNHLDTEGRQLVIKDGNDNNHAISKSQLDSAINNLQQQITLLQNQIKNSENR